MKMIAKIFHDSTTGIDGKTFDPARVLWIFGTIMYMVLSAHTTFTLAKPFDYQSFGIGFGAMLAAGGWAVNVKAATEPAKMVDDKKDHV